MSLKQTKAVSELNKILEETDKLVNEKIERNKKEIAATEEIIKQKAEVIDECIKKENAAINTANQEEYEKASSEKQQAAKDKYFQEKRLVILKEQPLVSAEEYEKRCELIISAFNKVFEEKKDEVVKTFEAVFHLGSNINRLQNDTNAVLRKWQGDMYKDADLVKNDHGVVLSTNRIKKVERWDLIRWCHACLEHWAYKALTGNVVKNGRIEYLKRPVKK